MKLFLLRHAESESNEKKLADARIDSPLSKKGRMQANKLVKILSENKYDIIIISPLKRTFQTIEPFLKILKSSEVEVSKMIIERDLGEFTGTKLGTFQKYCKENKLNVISTRPKNGESVLDVYKRAKQFLKYLNKKYKNKQVLVCGHRAFLFCLETAIKKQDIYKKYKNYRKKALKSAQIRKFNL